MQCSPRKMMVEVEGRALERRHSMWAYRYTQWQVLNGTSKCTSQWSMICSYLPYILQNQQVYLAEIQRPNRHWSGLPRDRTSYFTTENNYVPRMRSHPHGDRNRPHACLEIEKPSARMPRDGEAVRPHDPQLRGQYQVFRRQDYVRTYAHTCTQRYISI